MPNRNIRLTPEHDALLETILKSGDYHDAGEAVGDALHALRLRREEDDLRLERLRVAVSQGVAALDRGDYIEVDENELDAFLDSLDPPPAS
jgi:antitoxin ParD1/3/4